MTDSVTELMASTMFATDWPGDKWDNHVNVGDKKKGTFVPGPDHAARRYIDMAQAAQTALAAAGLVVAQGWRTIDTFDGRTQAVLVWCPANLCTYGAYFRDGQWFVFGSGRIPIETHAGSPTHWQPLPLPPEGR